MNIRIAIPFGNGAAENLQGFNVGYQKIIRQP
jgi:hypothetical protein